MIDASKKNLYDRLGATRDYRILRPISSRRDYPLQVIGWYDYIDGLLIYQVNPVLPNAGAMEQNILSKE